MGDQQPIQLTLGVKLRDDARFENFHVNAANQALLSILTDTTLDHHLIYLWGAANSGKSHLVQASCYQQAETGRGVLYLPLCDAAELDPAILQGADSLALVCLDDIDAVAGNAAWEQAIFNLYNDLQESDTRLLVSAPCPPLELRLQLADLHSRLQSGLTFQVAAMSDADKSAMLRLRAANRGMELSGQVADYIVRRADRNPDQLILLLDKLDNESLRRRRRLTIPLVQQVMEW